MALRACVLLRRSGDYRRREFEAGLRRCGFEVSDRAAPDVGNVLLIWNRTLRHESLARQYEARGGLVLVAENGWIGTDRFGEKLFALCRSHHNGAGYWPVGNEDRWSRLGVDVRPWRCSGSHILVLPQRGIGEPGIAMPAGWAADVVRRIKTSRAVRISRHPAIERNPPQPDLSDCWAVVTWASGAAIKAIVLGIPAFHEFKQWIGAGAARFGLDIENPFLGDRLPMLHRLSHGQWSAAEITGGEPFARFMNR